MSITLNDPNAAEAFYTQKLGFHPLQRFGAISSSIVGKPYNWRSIQRKRVHGQ
jgi:hypothetical protein